MNVAPTITRSNIGLKLALKHPLSVVEEPHVSVFVRMSINVPAESDYVVAAGDSGEDARLDVHRSVTASWSVRVVELHRTMR